MPNFRPACGACDDIVRAKGVALVAKAKLALAFEDEEQLLLRVVAMERALRLAGRQNGEIIAELLRADMIADRCAFRCVKAVLLDIVEVGLVEIHHRLHGALSPYGVASRETG